MHMPELVPANENNTTPTPTTRSMFDPSFLYGVNQFAAQYFEAQFWRSTEASTFCRLRGISEALLHECRVGYAPESGVEFCDLIQKHCSAELCQESGLLSWKADSTSMYLARFRDRLMFPIHDNQGRVVAFSGLSLAIGEKKGPRCLESNATMVYSPTTPTLNMKNITMRVLQLQVLAAELDVETWQEFALADTRPMRELVKMVGMLGMRYGDRGDR
jgi:hypothetical protein